MAYGFNDDKEKRDIIEEMSPVTSGIYAQINSLNTRFSRMETTVSALQSNMNTMQATISNLQTRVNDAQTKISNYWKTVYPIGSIYLSTAPVNPAVIIGGTWVAWGAGRVPVGINPSDPDFNGVEKTGGEKKHVLTVNEIPSHYHSARVMADNDPSPSYGESNYFKAGADSQEGGTNTESTGGGLSHNNLQPYIVCYMWKRIS